jgi:hypothetical protein
VTVFVDCAWFCEHGGPVGRYVSCDIGKA